MSEHEVIRKRLAISNEGLDFSLESIKGPVEEIVVEPGIAILNKFQPPYEGYTDLSLIRQRELKHPLPEELVPSVLAAHFVNEQWYSHLANIARTYEDTDEDLRFVIAHDTKYGTGLAISALLFAQMGLRLGHERFMAELIEQADPDGARRRTGTSPFVAMLDVEQRQKEELLSQDLSGFILIDEAVKLVAGEPNKISGDMSHIREQFVPDFLNLGAQNTASFYKIAFEQAKALNQFLNTQESIE